MQFVAHDLIPLLSTFQGLLPDIGCHKIMPKGVCESSHESLSATVD